MAARELRYQWFEELLETEGYDFIATAHHLDDSLETILMNLVKGSGYEGISGIKVKAGKVIRPMLFASKQEILEYAQANNIEWREDSSNSLDKYQRNFLRNNVVPLLRHLNPGLDKTFSETHERLSESWKLFRNGLQTIFKELIEYRNDQTLIDRIKLNETGSPSLVLWEMTKGFGFNYDQCRVMVSLSHSPGSIFHSPTHQITIDRTNLIVSRRVGMTVVNEVINENDEKVDSVLGTIRLSRVDKLSQIDKSTSVAQLDSQKIQFPLTWRTWTYGDSFFPLGMEHSKKISDFLVDAKVSLPDKDRVSVVVDKNGAIVWVVGHRIDNRFKISHSTERVVRLEYESR
jgi:tRNA(Ile)-lysidine synthase